MFFSFADANSFSLLRNEKSLVLCFNRLEYHVREERRRELEFLENVCITLFLLYPLFFLFGSLYYSFSLV